jgi:hypothetical protein
MILLLWSSAVEWGRGRRREGSGLRDYYPF